jgi:hypothetical protein
MSVSVKGLEVRGFACKYKYNFLKKQEKSKKMQKNIIKTLHIRKIIPLHFSFLFFPFGITDN